MNVNRSNYIFKLYSLMKNMKILIFSMVFFSIFCGMKIILKDGNFIEVSKYQKLNDLVRVEIKREKLDIPIYLIDMRSTIRLNEIENKGFSIFKNYSLLLYEKNQKEIYRFYSDDSEKVDKKAVPKIKLETRKESNPFFMELPDQKLKDEDFIERIKKKGIFLKFNIPVKQ